VSDTKIYPPGSDATANTWMTEDQYQEMYQRSIAEPDEFWAEQANELIDWFTPWEKVQSVDFHKADIKWFEGAKLNVSHNCLDRHLETRGDQVAIIWEADDPTKQRKITYKELHAEVCQFASALKGLGVNKGDRICIYMPMIPEAAVAMLACTRIGAVPYWLERWQRCLVSRSSRSRLNQLPCRGNGCRRLAVHSLHLRLYR